MGVYFFLFFLFFFQVFLQRAIYDLLVDNTNSKVESKFTVMGYGVLYVAGNTGILTTVTLYVDNLGSDQPHLSPKELRGSGRDTALF